MELLYSLTPLNGSQLPSIGIRRKIRSNSEPTNHSSIFKKSKIFIRISDQYQLFKIIKDSETEMNCLRGTESTPIFPIKSYKTLPKSFIRGRDRQSFLRRSFHSVRKNFVRQSERFMGKHFKAKPKLKRSRNHESNHNKILNDLNNFSTYNDRTLPNSEVCDIVFGSDKSVPDTTSKNRQSRSSNSVQSPSIEITSTKRHLSPEPHNPVSTEITNNHTINNTNDKIISSGNDKHKRKSMSDVVIVQGKLTTYSSIKNDLSVKQTSEAIKSNAMPSLITKSNGSAGSNQITTVANNPTQDVHLQPRSMTVSTNLSSNSSLNSSSVKSTTSKSNDGASTEKKPKSTSRSRQKKFHRHFKQVAFDEEVINFFSCAFVSDILLQGYLYITKNHFAFYSNVFGYVTKLLIPITSVTKISKEKTVKIIPNAIAVVTSDERLVFSNFLSRESAFQLMIQVWKDAMPNSDIDVLTSSAQLRITLLDTNLPMDSANTKPIFAKVSPKHLLQVVAAADLDASEMDDDSSSALSGNECLTKILSNKTNANEPPDVSSSSSVCNNNINNEASNCDLITANCESASDFNSSARKIEADSAMPETPATPKIPLDQSTINFLTFKLPRTIHIAYFGLLLVIILTLIAIFLFYRIVEMKNTRMRSFSANDLKSDSIPSLEHLAEILKWQKDMQDHRVHLTKNVLANNLEQISQISDNLQTLSNLIHTKEENINLNDELSTIMSECNSNIESCIIDQTAPNN